MCQARIGSEVVAEEKAKEWSFVVTQATTTAKTATTTTTTTAAARALGQPADAQRWPRGTWPWKKVLFAIIALAPPWGWPLTPPAPAPASGTSRPPTPSQSGASRTWWAGRSSSGPSHPQLSLAQQQLLPKDRWQLSQLWPGRPRTSVQLVNRCLRMRIQWRRGGSPRTR